MGQLEGREEYFFRLVSCRSGLAEGILVCLGQSGLTGLNQLPVCRPVQDGLVWFGPGPSHRSVWGILAE